MIRCTRAEDALRLSTSSVYLIKKFAIHYEMCYAYPIKGLMLHQNECFQQLKETIFKMKYAKICPHDEFWNFA